MVCPRVSHWPLKFASARSRDLSRVLVYRRCIIFPPALAKLARMESRITDIRHRRARRVEPLVFLFLLLLLFLLLFLLPSKPTSRSSWSMPAFRHGGKNIPQYSIVFTRTPAGKWCEVLASSNWCVSVYKKDIPRSESSNICFFFVRNWIKFEVNAIFQINWTIT